MAADRGADSSSENGSESGSDGGTDSAPQVAPAASRPVVVAELREFWWVWLVLGIGWTIVALVILEIDTASVTTVGVIIGAMFLVAGIQEFMIAAIADGWRWLWITFGILFMIAGLVAFAYPDRTFASFANMLGFLFLVVAVFWIIEAFATKDSNPLWWLGLTSGIIMLVLAFWTAGQFFFEKATILLVFSGIWALLHGITDIIKAFQIRRVGTLVAS